MSFEAKKKRSCLIASLSMSACACFAQQGTEISYDSPEEALAALRAEPGAIIQENEEWIIVSIEGDNVRSSWSFTPPGHPAHPAVVRITSVGEIGASIRVDTLCEAPIDVCDALIQERMWGEVTGRIITPENAESFDYSVNLQHRGEPHLYAISAEMPKIRDNGYEYAGTSVEFRTNDGVVLRWQLPSFDVAGNRLFVSLAGSKEWLACLTLISSFRDPNPDKVLDPDADSISSFQMSPILFLEAASEISSGATQACAEATLGR